MKIELGGSGVNVNGKYARGDGWLNVDIDPTADVQHDLNKTPWPIESDSVDEVYSSHCLEHLECPFAFFGEIARICKLNAKIEIKVPHPGSHMAMCAGHRHVFSPLQALNHERYFTVDFWRGPRRLKLLHIGYNATVLLEEAKQELPFLAGIDDQVIMRWIPGTCHESVFEYVCVPNEHYQHDDRIPPATPAAGECR